MIFWTTLDRDSLYYDLYYTVQGQTVIIEAALSIDRENSGDLQHRILKPSNVFLRNVARYIGTRLHTQLTFPFTIHHMR